MDHFYIKSGEFIPAMARKSGKDVLKVRHTFEDKYYHLADYKTEDVIISEYYKGKIVTLWGTDGENHPAIFADASINSCIYDAMENAIENRENLFRIESKLNHNNREYFVIDEKVNDTWMPVKQNIETYLDAKKYQFAFLANMVCKDLLGDIWESIDIYDFAECYSSDDMLAMVYWRSQKLIKNFLIAYLENYGGLK